MIESKNLNQYFNKIFTKLLIDEFPKDGDTVIDCAGDLFQISASDEDIDRIRSIAFNEIKNEYKDAIVIKEKDLKDLIEDTIGDNLYLKIVGDESGAKYTWNSIYWSL